MSCPLGAFQSAPRPQPPPSLPLSSRFNFLVEASTKPPYLPFSHPANSDLKNAASRIGKSELATRLKNLIA